MKKLIIVSTLHLTLLSYLYADDNVQSKYIYPYSLGVNVGSLGLGINLSLPLKEDFSLRINANKFTYNLNKKYKKFSFDGNLDLFNTGLLLDYFPVNNFFRLSAGGYINKNKVSGSSKFNKSIIVNVYNQKQKITDTVTIESEVKFDTISPYIGVGWGNDIQKKGWNTTLDIGVMYQGLPKIEFDATTKYTMTKDILKKDIQKEKARIKNFANKYKFYPVIAVGISYSF